MNKDLELLLGKIYLKIFPLKIMRPHLHKINTFIGKVVNKYDLPGTRILDIGAEGSPYGHLFVNSEYYSHDIVQNEEGSIDYIGDLNEGIPDIPSNALDYILCTQVLEHVKKPHMAFKEFHRVLKPGGKLFLTTHMVFDEHMVPNDFFRFTKYGLNSLGEEAGFKVIHRMPQGGVFLVIANILNEMPIKILFKRDTWLYYVYFILFTIPIFLLNLMLYLLDFLDKEKSLTTNYEYIYEKL